MLRSSQAGRTRATIVVACHGHRQEAQPAEEYDGSRWQGESAGVVGVARRRPEPGREHERGGEENDADDEAPAAVERRHDRPSQNPLDGDVVGVHRDVHRAVRGTEEEEDRAKQVRVGRDQRQRRQRGESWQSPIVAFETPSLSCAHGM